MAPVAELKIYSVARFLRLCRLLASIFHKFVLSAKIVGCNAFLSRLNDTDIFIVIAVRADLVLTISYCSLQ